MKTASEILKELAFNPVSEASTQEAFLRNLQRTLLENKKAEVIPLSKVKIPDPQQLSFDFESASLVQGRLKKTP